MVELAKKRLADNFKQSIKYLALVFNDFFILALLFLFGGLMFWYAQKMQVMPDNLWFYKPLAALILALPLFTGKLVTLLKEADAQFLFTQDRQIKQYLKPLLGYSLLLPSLFLLILAGILFPFVLFKAHVGGFMYAASVIFILVSKFIQLLIARNNLFFTKKINLCLFNLVTIIFLMAGFYLAILLVIGFIWLIFLGIYVSQKELKLFNWRLAIKKEMQRKALVYSIFSMFTDVKEKTSTIKRRKYLDFLLPKNLAKETANTFLYRRSLLRNPENLNLLVRMTVFAVLISFLVQNYLWALALSALVIFLTAYQLLPLANEFADNVMYRIYPFEKDDQKSALVKVLSLALIMQWLIIIVCWLFVLPLNLNLLLAACGLLIFTGLIIGIYLPLKLKRGGKL